MSCCLAFLVLGLVHGTSAFRLNHLNGSSKSGVANRFEGTCSNHTGGTCGIFGCRSSRNALCVDGACICDTNRCAENGKCVALATTTTTTTTNSCPTEKQVHALPGHRRWCGDCPKCNCGCNPIVGGGKTGPLCTWPLDKGGECYQDDYPSGAIGAWEPLNWLTGIQEISATHGTAKSNSAQKTGTWASEVTSTVTAGLEVSAGFIGYGGKFTAEASLSAGLRAQLSHSYSKEWTLNKEETFKITFSQDEGYLWQWIVQLKMNDGSYLKTKTRDYAITDGKWQKPTCLPGYGLDMPRYQSCRSNATTLPE